MNLCYNDDDEPSHGFCMVCKRKRPIGVQTMNNFGCFEADTDDEDNEEFGPGTRMLRCGGCGSVCKPVFD